MIGPDILRHTFTDHESFPDDLTSSLPPPSPTGYERCYLTRSNPSEVSAPAEFAIQTIPFLPTGRQTLSLDVMDLSILTRSQRDSFHYILEDRNRRTEGHGRWVLIGLGWDEGGSEDFELSIMFCEYGAPAAAPLEFSKPFYLATTAVDAMGGERDGELENEGSEGSEEEGEDVEEMINAWKVDKGKKVAGPEHSKMCKEQDSGAPAPEKDFTPVGIRADSKTGGNIPASHPANEFPIVPETSTKGLGHDVGCPSTSKQNASQETGRPQTRIQRWEMPSLHSKEFQDLRMLAWNAMCAGSYARATLLFKIILHHGELLLGQCHSEVLATMRMLAHTYDMSAKGNIAAVYREEANKRRSFQTSNIGEATSTGIAQTRFTKFTMPSLALTQFVELNLLISSGPQLGKSRAAIFLCRIILHYEETILGESHEVALNTMRLLREISGE
ncbi:hypothetical protein RUND412_007930 [Rhizina undulata]